MANNVAAVLIGIIDGKIVLTKRSTNLRSFAGQICLPGGGYELKHDSLFSDAAKREFCEEINYSGDIIELCCMEPEFSLVSQQIIYPVVAHLTGDVAGFNAEEVEKIIYLPRECLNYDLFVINKDYPTIKHNQCFTWDGELVWGLTAYILYKFMDIYPMIGCL